MKSIFKAIGTLFVISITAGITTLFLFALMGWFNRIEVTDPNICANNETLAQETSRRLKAGEMTAYQMLYCPEMKDRWGISLSK